MKIYGHRGFSAKYPENTVLSIQKALDAGTDGVEIDIRPNSKGILVLSHDRHIKKSAPTLEAVLKKFGNKLILNIEVKTPAVSDNLFTLLKKLKINPKQVIVSSFFHSWITKMKKKHAVYPMALITASEEMDLGAKAKKTHIEYIHAFWERLTPAMVYEIKKNKVQINVWTINDKDVFKKVRKLRVAGVIGDDVKNLRKWLLK
jgi:glycerophosphoryl diester phosphodiesterase